MRISRLAARLIAVFVRFCKPANAAVGSMLEPNLAAYRLGQVGSFHAHKTVAGCGVSGILWLRIGTCFEGACSAEARCAAVLCATVS